MSKSTWKFNHLDSSIYKNIFLSKFKKIKILKIFDRKSTIPKIFSKRNINLYKGNVFTKISFTKYNIGYKIGEFNITRKPFSFPKKKNKIFIFNRSIKSTNTKQIRYLYVLG